MFFGRPMSGFHFVSSKAQASRLSSQQTGIIGATLGCSIRTTSPTQWQRSNAGGEKTGQGALKYRL